MYREQLQFNRQPFQETIDTAFFFSGGRRRAVVDEIKQSLARSVPLLVLTGDEGAGKTMVCRMVEKELPVDLTLVFLPKTIDAFDEMVKIVAQEMDIETGSDEKRTETKVLLQEILSKLQERGKRLVVVFDEAEKIFLATLERIRKLLDQANQDTVCLQILFSGNQQLLDNLQQLSIVSFQEVEECHYELEPLGQDAIWDYGNYCVKVATGKSLEFFSRDIADKIASGSGGNFRKINHFSLEYLQTEKFDSSFMSLLDDIEDGPEKPQKQESVERRLRTSSGGLDSTPDYLNFSKMIPRWVYYGGGVCVVLIMLFMVTLQLRDQEVVKNDDTQEVPDIVLKKVEPLDAPVKQEEHQEKGGATKPLKSGIDNAADTPTDKKAGIEKKVLKTVAEEPSVEKTASVSEKKIVLIDTKSQADTEKTDDEITAMVEKSTVEADSAFTDLVTAKSIAEKPSVDEEADISFDKTKENPVGIKQSVPEKEVVAEARKIVSTETVKQFKPLEPVKILKDGQKKKPIDIPAESVEVLDETVSSAVALPELRDELSVFKERLAAGARWLVGAGSDKYTVQLMVLTSESAEDNLKNMLRTPEYQGIADHLYVLRRIGVISTVMVFYGEYPSLAAARNARNNLPVFLRKHHPYAISVHGAVEKANAIQ